VISRLWLRRRRQAFVIHPMYVLRKWFSFTESPALKATGVSKYNEIISP